MENSQIIELVKKVSEERNELAFSEIFDFIAPKINAYYVKNNIGIEQAEELTQEVLSTIWLKAEQFDPEKSKFITSRVNLLLRMIGILTNKKINNLATSSSNLYNIFKRFKIAYTF